MPRAFLCRTPFDTFRKRVRGAKQFLLDTRVRLLFLHRPCTANTLGPRTAMILRATSPLAILTPHLFSPEFSAARLVFGEFGYSPRRSAEHPNISPSFPIRIPLKLISKQTTTFLTFHPLQIQGVPIDLAVPALYMRAPSSPGFSLSLSDPRRASLYGTSGGSSGIATHARLHTMRSSFRHNVPRHRQHPLIQADKLVAVAREH